MPHPLLFVYGTLTDTAGHRLGDLLKRHGTRIGSGSIRARLYLIDDPDLPGEGNFYPGALPSPDPDDRVWGEVHEVHAPDILFPQFDTYEGCSPDWPEPHEFLRRLVEVTLQDGSYTHAQTYLYTWDVSRAVHLPTGRFTARAPDVH
ncbi:gamma-glutamylcyclotransferase family protein [Sagittula salina]|uniref:Gamma-glutamylcyclotransferase n=1 Tax=Sagittula salina TaxID=2820268 RepID=A0A940MJL3_9RHOB|nr:gamma-glutamylcyclotransferase family protein [Sagittula salina]MBP0482711.1 gamma-glutamylcyclotransferase [Sagittula salina]